MILSRAASRENRKAIAAQQVLRVKVSRMERKIGIVHRLTVFIGMLASSLCIREECGFEISVNESRRKYFFFQDLSMEGSGKVDEIRDKNGRIDWFEVKNIVPLFWYL